MNNSGFIKIHRKILSWEWYGDVPTKTVFLHLLLTANYKDHKWQGRLIKRGQVIIGRTKLAKELGLSEQQVRTALKKLENSGEINQLTTNRFTVLTICNYSDYQDVQPTSNQPSNQQATNKQPTDNQQTTTIKEVKEEKEEKEYQEVKKKPLSKVSLLDEEIASYLAGKIKAHSPAAKCNTKKWADDIRKMRTIDHRGPEEIRKVIDFATTDNFWHQNILSAGKLREKFDQLELKARSGGNNVSGSKMGRLKDGLQNFLAKENDDHGQDDFRQRALCP